MQSTSHILDRIIARKREILPTIRAARPESELECMPGFSRTTRSLSAILKAGSTSGIIAEFKRQSPSKGVINGTADVRATARAYATGGAAAMSILTDEDFFGGSVPDLEAAREVIDIPILRKDFVIDEYQILEARAIGADLILLIAACLTPQEVRRLAAFAGSLGLETLLELHAEEELDHVCDEVQLVGINNRDLKTFAVDIDRSLRMAERLPADRVRIAESGIDAVEQVRRFRDHGFHGFLMGEQFMKSSDPGDAFARFAASI